MRNLMALALILASTIGSASAGLVSIDWDSDSSADGISSGILLGHTVSLTSTNGSVNGGITGFAANWASQLGTNNVPGVGDAGVVSEGAAVDWLSGQSGFAQFDFGTGTVTDPILMFNFLDRSVETFDFDDGLNITLLDQWPGNEVLIGAGNLISTAGGATNSSNDGFAIQIDGTFSQLGFLTNVGLGVAESVGVTFAVDDANFVPNAAVPEPSSILCFGLLGIAAAARRRRSRR